MRTGFLVLCGVACAAVGFASAPAASAATKPPVLLGVGDVPSGFQQGAAPTTDASFNTVVVNAARCTEKPQTVGGLTGAVSVFFTRTAGAPGFNTLYEFVLSFPDAKAAKASFMVELKSATAGAKCGTVGFVSPGGTAPISMVKLGLAKFPKVGGASFALSTTPPGGVANTTVEFVRGAYVVMINVSGPAATSVDQELKTTVARANKLLRG